MADMVSSAGGDSSSAGGSTGSSQGSTSGGTQGASSGGAGASNTPSVVELSHDHMVKLPGAKDPTKFGDWHRGLQSQLTRASQLAAQRENALKEAQQRISQYEDQLRRSQGVQNPAPKPGADLINKIKQLQYLSGEDAANVVENLVQQIHGYQPELEKRDLALGLIFKRLQQAEAMLQQVHGRNSQSDFDAKMRKIVTDLDLPQEAERFARVLYLAHEQDDALDAQFPQLLKDEWDANERLIQSRIQKRAQAARQSFIPGKGGGGAAGQGLKDLAKASSQDVADKLWDSMVNGAQDT